MTEIIVWLVLLLGGVLAIWMLIPCFITKRHRWYGGEHGDYTCGTYNRTGPLPGESKISGRGKYDKLIYRRERHCLECGYKEYWTTEECRWLPIPKEGG